MLQEAGMCGIASVVLFTVGLLAIVARRSEQAAGGAVPWVLGLLALGQLGQGLGQRLVGRAVDDVGAIENKLSMLNAGASEAAANLVLSGACAALLLVVGVALARVRSR